MNEFRSVQEDLNLLQLQNDLEESRRNARNVLRTIAGAVVLGILFLGAALVLSACSPPPEQPDLNTYGAMQPVCLFWCHQVFTLSEGDGSSGGSSATVTETITRNVQ